MARHAKFTFVTHPAFRPSSQYSENAVPLFWQAFDKTAPLFDGGIDDYLNTRGSRISPQSKAESDAWVKANRAAMAAHYQMPHIDKPRNGYHAKRRDPAFVFVPLDIWFAVEGEHILECKQFGCGICCYLYDR